MNRRLALIVLCALAMAVPGCRRTQEPARSAGPTTIRLVMYPYMSHLPFHIAQEEGYFAEEGIEIESVPLTTSGDASALLISGAVDVSSAPVTAGLLNGIARGASVRFVADKGYAPADDPGYVAFVVHKDLFDSGKLSDPANWKGMTFDTNPDPEIRNFLLARLLAQAGLKEEDVRTVAIPPVADCEALKNGAIDCSINVEPWNTRMIAGGYGALWKSAGAVCPDLQIGCVIYGQRLLETDRDAGHRFMRGYMKGVAQYNQGKTARNLEIAARHTELDVETLKAAVWPPIHEDGHVNLKSLDEFQEWCMKKGALDRKIPAEDLWDGSFIEQAAGK